MSRESGRTIKRAAYALLLGATLALATARRSSAQEVSGVVLALDGSEVILDLGKKQGISDNDVLELWRPLKLKHPVTGKLVSDRFRIGSVKVTQVREVMSLAKPTAPLTRPVEAGDVVILVGAPKPTVSAPPPKPTTTTPGAPTTAAPASTVYVDSDPEVRALGTLFESLHGTSPEVRAKAYDEFIKANPKSRFAGVLQEEIIALRKAAAAGYAPPGPTAPEAQPAPHVRSWRKIEETVADTPLVVAFELEGPIAGAVLQVRTADEPAFTPIPFVARGDGYWSVFIPRDRVRPPTMTWFVEAVGTDGKATPIIGTAGEPLTTKVTTKAGALTPLKHKNVAAIWTDYADYNRWKGNDWAFQTEGYFGMRFQDVGVRAVRSGFGVYRGKGGSIEELDRPVPVAPRSVGLSYGYLEGEFGLDPFWGIIARAIVGLGNDGVNGGAQGFLRIGNDQKTNLMIGGEILGGIGLRGITQLQLATFPRIPILLRSEVTNQPAGERRFQDPLDPNRVASERGEIGVRAIAQIGYQLTPALTVFVRGSYQGRTIIHAGPGFGGGVSFTW